MQHVFYVAHSPESARRPDLIPAPLAGLGIALGSSPDGAACCKTALILPREPSRPVLRVFSGPPGTQKRLHRLAIKEASLEARARHVPAMAADFAPGRWDTLQRWIFLDKVTRKALDAMMEHLGNPSVFTWIALGKFYRRRVCTDALPIWPQAIA